MAFASALSLLASSGSSWAQETRATWRSVLYPQDWTPSFTGSSGRFLHDFSYAGYHRGEKPLPVVQRQVIDATQAPFFADRSGAEDSAPAIQAALDSVAQRGGGVVFLPAGVYRLLPPEGRNAVLAIKGSNIILRGAGPGVTFLHNDSLDMRGKTIIKIQADNPADWHAEGKGFPSSALARDLQNRASQVVVEDAGKFQPGDLVILRSDLTQRFIDEVDMTGHWKPAGAGSPNRTLIFCRRILRLDRASNTLILDAPVRYPMKTADRARVVKIAGNVVSEIGLEGFSIGMKEHPDRRLGEDDYDSPGTAAYDAHGSSAVVFSNAENCWMRRVETYAPPGNAPDVHLLSNGLRLVRSRYVTVEDCALRHPQYRGGGGNGYLYNLLGQECLIRNCVAEGARHNYDFGTMACSGNVITRSLAKDGTLASDFHMFLSMANLLDNVTCDGDFLEARYFRPWGGNPVHGVTTTQSVFWNTNGLRYSREKQILVESNQLHDGYVIGTRGPACKVESNNFVEGVGEGDRLEPPSLYEDQCKRRAGRKEIAETGASLR